MAKRRPVRVEYTRTVYYGGSRPRQKRWPWTYIIAGLVALVILPREPMLAALILAIVFYLWRKRRA
jgi:hypothetical protein